MKLMSEKKDEKEQKKDNILRNYGFIAYFIERLFRALQFLPPQVLFDNRVDYQDKFDEKDKDINRRLTQKRCKKIDMYICVFFIMELIAIMLSANDILKNIKIFRYIILVIIIARIIDIVQVNINSTIFDNLRGKKSIYIASAVRMIVNIILNYFEVTICFGIIYSIFIDKLQNADNWFDGIYFSCITQSIIGGGDIVANGSMKLVVCIQGAIGFLFSMLIISRFTALLPSIKEISVDEDKE